MRLLGKMSEEEYITIAKASRYAGVSKEEIFEAIRKGDVKSNKRPCIFPNKVCKESVAAFFAEAIEKKNCKMLGLIQAAKFLKVSRLEFYRLIEDGVFETTGKGFDSQIKVSDLEKYLNKK